MSRRVSPHLRRRVAARADFLCEYCLIAEEDTYFGCEVEHIISLKHGGSSAPQNLAYACAFCNRHKGTDIGSLAESSEFIRFFKPRADSWAVHFQSTGAVIQPLTVIGEVTARILRFNHKEQILVRQALLEAGRYPSQAARARIES